MPNSNLMAFTGIHLFKERNQDRHLERRERYRKAWKVNSLIPQVNKEEEMKGDKQSCLVFLFTVDIITGFKTCIGFLAE